jgi:hypothetical protein
MDESTPSKRGRCESPQQEGLDSAPIPTTSRVVTSFNLADLSPTGGDQSYELNQEGFVQAEPQSERLYVDMLPASFNEHRELMQAKAKAPMSHEEALQELQYYRELYFTELQDKRRCKTTNGYWFTFCQLVNELARASFVPDLGGEQYSVSMADLKFNIHNHCSWWHRFGGYENEGFGSRERQELARKDLEIVLQYGAYQIKMGHKVNDQPISSVEHMTDLLPKVHDLS